jgi:kynurenine formamidase
MKTTPMRVEGSGSLDTGSLDTGDWFPSRWGADDTSGALNEITAAKVVSAARLVRRGRVFDLAHVLHAAVPAFPGRTFRQWMHERAPDEGLGANRVHWVAERFEATTQMGTHVDGLNHLHVGKRTYNGHDVDEIVTSEGTTRLGIETMPQVLTRGLLVDVAGWRGVERLAAGDVITPAEVASALASDGLSVEPGDAVLFHTGWGSLWDTDPEHHPDRPYLAGQPGPGRALGEWLADRRVALTGCDTWSYGPVPAEDADEPFVVPQILNVRHGIVVMENLRLGELAAAGVHEFLLVAAHPKLLGATGAWLAPLAVV